MDIEVLVHVKAPARAVDDRKYVAIAQGVLDFEPARMTLIQNGDSRESGSQSSDVISSTQLRSSFVPESALSIVKSPQVKTKRTNSIRDQVCISKTDILTRRSSAQRKVDNPPFRSPLRNKSSAVVNVYATPSAKNLVALANGSQPALVPSTGGQIRNQTSSEINTPCSTTALVANSQPALSMNLADQSWSTWSQSISQPVEMTATNSHTDPDSYLTAAELNDTCHQIQDAKDVAIPETSEHDNELDIQDVDQAWNSDERKQYRRHSTQTTLRTVFSAATAQKNTMNVTAMETGSDSSAATLTQRSSVPPGTNRLNDTYQSPIPATSHIDLVTPDFSVPAKVCEATDQGQERIINDTTRCSPSTIRTMGTSSFFASGLAKLRALPPVIDAPQAKASQLFLSASEHPVLKATAGALGVPERFRPQTMTRAVKGTERGYWQIPFHVTDSAYTQATRPIIPEQPQDPKFQSREPLLRHATLAEDDFISIWTDLTEFIGSGKAGWDVKVMRRCLSVKQNQRNGDVFAEFHLQVFCYGESIPYVYALLLVCTRMHVLCKPIQWISAIDDKPVLTMAGDEISKGNLRDWTSSSDGEGREYWYCA